MITVLLLWFRDDLHIPSSPYFPAYAQGGQGPPPMVQERFMSVISQLFQYVRLLFAEISGEYGLLVTLL